MTRAVHILAAALLAAASSHAQNTSRWGEATQKANALISQLNLTAKASLVTGWSDGPCVGNIAPLTAVNFSGLCLQDGPLAIRMADLASVFPAGVSVAATWDRDLMYERGLAMGQEFRGKGAHVMLGPVAGPLGRHALGGRNWEGFSPDPYLTGVAMEHTITGIQDAGVQASAKHYIGNEQETQRSNTVSENEVKVDAISSNIDDRTLHEVYLWPFANAVKAGVASVMCSYNRLNETYACENPTTLNKILKGELGFQGYVVSDWGATHSGVKAIEAGLDMSMPGSSTYFGSNLTLAVSNGTLPESRLDDMVRRVLTPYFYLNQDSGFPTVDPSTSYVSAASNGQAVLDSNLPAARDVRADHASLIRKIGAEAVVLLKNVNGTLPLQDPRNIGVFGNDAGDPSAGYYLGFDTGTYGFEMGTLNVGGGSGTGRNSYVVSPLEAIRKRTLATGARLQYLLDNTLIANDNFAAIYPTPDVCLVFLKTYAREGYDRISLENDWNSTAVVEAVAKHCPNTIVITHSAGINTMPWAHNPNISGILAAHYPGQESGHAIADILFGAVNPSGHLPYTIPQTTSDTIPILNLTGAAATNSSAWQAPFTEGPLIDYRRFTAHNITPLYPFGYGLSYTTFALTAPLTITNQTPNLTAFPPSAPSSPGGNPNLYTPILTLSTTVSNTGTRPGAVVVQLYLASPAPPPTPPLVLRGFEKVTLDPGEAAPVTFALTRRDVSFWNVTAGAWQIPAGEFVLRAGFSVEDLGGGVRVALV